MLDALAQELLHPEVILQAVRRTVARPRPSQEQAAARKAKLMRDLATVEGELSRLIQTILAGAT